MCKSVFSETSLFLDPTGTTYGATICTHGTSMQFGNADPPQSPRELWFPDLQCSGYTNHSDSVVVINIEMSIELEKSCHLSFSCKIFWYSFHWFFWGSSPLEIFVYTYRGVSYYSCRSSSFPFCNPRNRVWSEWPLRSSGQILLKHRNWTQNPRSKSLLCHFLGFWTWASNSFVPKYFSHL